MKKLQVSEGKYQALERLSTKDGIISALAIDQRGALKRMMKESGKEATQTDIEDFKKIISSELTPFASSILLDPEYGLPATKVRDSEAGLLLAYEKTGYDANAVGRLPDLLVDWSARRLKEQGADAVKFLLYYDVDEDVAINDQKHAFVERIGSECLAEDIPFFLEILSYDATDADNKSAKFAKVKPHKVIACMKEFSKDRYAVDVLKVEVPVNMNFVEGFAKGEVVYTQEEAKAYFKEQAEASHLPFIFLSAGVSAEMFQDTLKFAGEAGSSFNGVLCGRATWANSVEVFVKEGEEAAKTWMNEKGRQNIEELNEVVNQYAKPWQEKVNK